MMKRRLIFLLLYILLLHSFHSKSANYYWIGGTGNWSDINHWSNASGGATIGALPTAGDNIIFDALSNLTGATVTMDVAVTVVDFNFSLAPAFTLAGALPSIEIRGNLIANSTASVTYSGDINLFSNANTSFLTSSGRTWNNNFVLTSSTNPNGVSLTDNFTTTGTFTCTRGKFNTAGFNFSVQNFISPGILTRNIDFTNSIVTISGSEWRIEPGSLTLVTTGSTINLNNNGAVTFFGGGETYATLNSISTTLRLEGANTFGIVSLLTSSSLLLDSVLHTFSVLNFNGTCTANGFISPIFPTSPAPQILVSTSPFAASYLTINKVNAIAPTVYNLTNSNVSNSSGWTESSLGSNFYWIGDSGNWNDGSHWSNSSGGVAINCIPSSADSVIFDANSFSMADQIVTVNTDGYFKAMKWINIAQPQTLILDSVNSINAGNLIAFGDVTFHSNLKVSRVELGCAFEFVKNAKLTANSANIDGNFRVNMPVTDSLYLQGGLVMSDSSSFIMMQGTFNTSGQNFVTGSFTTLNDPSGITDTRILRLGASNVHLVQKFQAQSDLEFSLSAGTSNIYIGDTLQIIPDTLSYLNGLLTMGSNTLTFYNVTLNFQPIEVAATIFADQKVTGNHIFNKLSIIPGSRVQFQNGSTQTVNDSLLMVGTCTDSIFILSDGGGQFNITKSDTKVKAQCLAMEDCNISSPQTAYFSKDNANNANWTFDTSSPISASFTSTSPDCFGTVTGFTPTSTTVFSEPVSYFWQFNDGSTNPLTAEQFSGFSEDILNFSSPIGISVNDTLPITQWTEVSDPSSLFYPLTGNGTAYPSPNGTSINFNFDAHFKLSLENNTGSNAYLVDLDDSYYKVKYKYRPKVLIYKNGAPYSSVFLTATPFIYEEDTLTDGTHIPLVVGSTLLADDTVNVSLTINNLQPTDEITFYTSMVVSYDGYSQVPKWKDAYSIVATDVLVTYKMEYDSIKFTATPQSNNLTGLTHTFNDRGDFNVTMIATNTVNMCTDTVTNVVTIYGPISYLNTNQLDTTICAGEEVLFTASTSGDSTTLFTFLLNGDTIQGPSLMDSLLINTLSHLDTISLQTSNGGCNSLNDPYYQFVVNPLPIFSLDINPNDTICVGDTIYFAATPTSTGNHYRYKKNSSFVTSYDTLGLYSSSTLINNDTITLFTKSLSTGCIADSVVPITVNPLPTVTLTENSGDFIICSGDSVTFTASGAAQYEFFIGSTSQGVQVSPTFITTALLNGDIVSVIGINSTGCSKASTTTYSYTVITSPVVSININPGLTVCSGTNVEVTGTGATLYEFFLNGTSVAGPSTTNFISSSAYTNSSQFYFIGSSGGCASISDTLTLTVVASPSTTLSSSDLDNSICAGTSVTFTGGGATNYQFFVNGVAQGSSSPVDTFTSTTLSDGNVIMLSGESNGCIVNQQITMTVLNNPNVLLFSSDADNTICEGQTVTFTGSGASLYEFNVNGIAQPSQSSPDTTLSLVVGSNSVYVIGTASNGCSTQSTTITTTVNPNPIMTLTSSDADNVICAGEAVTFSASGANDYQFYIGSTAQGNFSPTSSFTTSNLTNGQIVTVVGSSLGCTSTSAGITMTVNPIPPVFLTSTDADNIFCVGDPVTFNSSGATSYEFFVNGVSQGAPSATSSLDGSTFVSGTYPVSVNGTSNGCSSTSTLNITVNALPTPSLTSSDSDNTICEGETVTYTASGGNLYEFFVDGNPSSSLGALATHSLNTLIMGNVVSVEVSNAQGCLSSIALPAIVVNPLPSVSLLSSDPDQQICIGDNVTFTASGASDYEFFINGVSQGASSPSDTYSTSALTNGQTVNVIGTSLGCQAVSNNLTFAVYGPPSVQLFNNGSSTTLCTGESTDLLASGATDYQFTVNGSPIGVFSPTATFSQPVNDGDVVSVIGQSNGCINPSSDSYTFTVNTYPVITSSSSDVDNTICLNDLVTFTATGATTYDFAVNGVTIQSGVSNTYSSSDLQNGDIVSIVGLNGNCASTDDSYSFIVNEMILDLNISPSSLVCADELVTFTASGGQQYEFFVNGISQGPLSTTATLSNTYSNLDEVTFTAFSASTGCTQAYYDYILMNVMDQPSTTPSGSIDICQGDSVILYSNSSYGNQWYLDGSEIAGATDTFYVAYNSGDYSLETTAGGLGTVWSFGYNAQGTFGNGTNINNSEPTEAVTTQQFDEISSGYDFMLGVNTSADVFAWGENSSGQLGNGTYTSSNLPIQVPSLTDIKTVATSQSSSIAITNTGSVYVWGNNSMGQLGTGNTSVINFPYLNSNLSNVDSIAGGKNHFVILKDDGTVWTVGNNDYGQLGQGNLISSMLPVQIIGLNNIVSVGAGEYHSFAISNSGDLYVWGNNGSGQLGLNDITNRLTPTISGLKNIINAQGGAAHSVFLSNNKKVHTAGGNQFGQLGTGDNLDYLLPTEILLSGAAMISAGEYTTLVKRQDNSVFGFGSNIEEQLSSTTGSSVNSPENIQGLSGVSFIEAGKSTSHVIYNEIKACVSATATVNMLAVPTVTITEADGVLSTISGIAYQWYFNGNEIPDASNQTWNALSDGIYTVAVTFANGCTGMSTDFPFGVNGLEELTKSFEVYPNPTTGILNVFVSSEFTDNDLIIQVRDMAGRIVTQNTAFNTETIQLDLSELVTGVYIVEVQTNNKTIGRKQIVKSH